MPKRVGRKHNWAEKDWAENKSGPKRDPPNPKWSSLFRIQAQTPGIKDFSSYVDTMYNINKIKHSIKTEVSLKHGFLVKYLVDH